MSNSILRAARASAAHLATAQRHAGAAARARADAARCGREANYSIAGDAAMMLRAEARRLLASATRSEALAARAMARYTAAQNRLGGALLAGLPRSIRTATLART